jgi:hypothetical protein
MKYFEIVYLPEESSSVLGRPAKLPVAEFVSHFCQLLKMIILT